MTTTKQITGIYNGNSHVTAATLVGIQITNIIIYNIIKISFISPLISEIRSTGARGRVIRVVRMGVRVGWRHPPWPVCAAISGSSQQLLCRCCAIEKCVHAHYTIIIIIIWSGAD